jgi:hypothetical protein
MFLDANIHDGLTKVAAEQGSTAGKLAAKVLAEYLEKNEN